MKIIDINNVEAKEVDGSNPLFFGGRVHTQFILGEEFGAKEIQIVNVKFAPGARNKFHAHTVGQILHVIEGKGIVATQEKEYTVTPGTIVFIDPGEVHWHGATDDSSFAHLSISGRPSELKIIED